MHRSPYILKDGSLVKTPTGQLGIVIAHDYRRDHHYLERDLWLLVLVAGKNEWLRVRDLEEWV